jgi:hypothetical protein
VVEYLPPSNSESYPTLLKLTWSWLALPWGILLCLNNAFDISKACTLLSNNESKYKSVELAFFFETEFEFELLEWIEVWLYDEPCLDLLLLGLRGELGGLFWRLTEGGRDV